MTACRFGAEHDEAVAVVALDAGCICYPEDREQALCLQHLNRATPIGSMRVLRWLTADGQPPVLRNLRGDVVTDALEPDGEAPADVDASRCVRARPCANPVCTTCRRPELVWPYRTALGRAIEDLAVAMEV